MLRSPVTYSGFLENAGAILIIWSWFSYSFINATKIDVSWANHFAFHVTAYTFLGFFLIMMSKYGSWKRYIIPAFVVFLVLFFFSAQIGGLF